MPCLPRRCLPRPHMSPRPPRAARCAVESASLGHVLLRRALPPLLRLSAAHVAHLGVIRAWRASSPLPVISCSVGHHAATAHSCMLVAVRRRGPPPRTHVSGHQEALPILMAAFLSCRDLRTRHCHARRMPHPWRTAASPSFVMEPACRPPPTVSLKEQLLLLPKKKILWSIPSTAHSLY
jgi:hypothetical protein